jgi:GAF domain-containing protein
MLARIRKFFVPLVFEDEERARVARLLRVVLLALLTGSALITLLAAVVYLFQPDPEALFTLLSGIVLTLSFLVLFLLARRGHLQLVSVVLLSFTWIVITVWIYSASGIASDSSSLTYALIVVLAGLLLGGRAAIITTAISVVAALGAYYAEASHLLVVADRQLSLADLFFVLIPLVLIGILLQYAINSLTQAIGRALRNERAQAEANQALTALQASLEQRVADRTAELESRSAQLQAAAEVSRAATSILDPEELIWQVAELIQERFDLYHVGLLLLDEAGEFAVYRAGSGEAGRELRERGFRLPVGGNSMVGWCTANAQARVAQDVSTETIHYRHDLVPRTASEAALPLRARGQILGALSVQSDRVGTFDPATVNGLQTMADQVSVALDNARLFAESQQALEATRRAYSQLTSQAWTDLLRGRSDWGYGFSAGAGLMPVHDVLPVEGSWPPEMVEALRTGQPVVRQPVGSPTEWGQGSAGPSGVPVSIENPASPEYTGTAPAYPGASPVYPGASPVYSGASPVYSGAVALPLKVREEIIGAVGFYRDSGDGAWATDEMELLRRLVDQLGTALESAQLFQETQRRAAREQAIRQITERMRQAVDVEAILQNTVVELAKALGVPRAYVRLGSEAEILNGKAGS